MNEIDQMENEILGLKPREIDSFISQKQYDAKYNRAKIMNKKDTKFGAMCNNTMHQRGEFNSGEEHVELYIDIKGMNPR